MTDSFNFTQTPLPPLLLKQRSCPAPDPIAPLPDEILFKPQLIGTTSPSQTLEVTNSSNTAIQISKLTANGDFRLNSNCGPEVAANSTCSISVMFTPTVLGQRTGNVAFTDPFTATPHTTYLIGNGVAAKVALSTHTLAFNSQKIGTTSAPQRVTFYSVGNIPVSISGIRGSGALRAE